MTWYEYKESDCDKHCYCIIKKGRNSEQCRLSYVRCCKCGKEAKSKAVAEVTGEHY